MSEFRLVPVILTPHMGHAMSAAIDDDFGCQGIWDETLRMVENTDAQVLELLNKGLAKSQKDQILGLIEDECRYWHGRDEARRGGYATLLAKVKEVLDK